MLIIYGGLKLGGIETFFLRLAKTSSENGRKLKFILLTTKSECNFELLQELLKYAEVYFYYDLFEKLPFLGTRFSLINPFKDCVLDTIVEGISIIHVSTGQHALLANRILKLKNLNLPITVGVYHSQEFCWSKGNLPYFEKMNRKYVFEYISDKNILCFSESTKDYLIRKSNFPLTFARTFRLGVIDEEHIINLEKKEFSSNKIRMCAVGRLVKFKTYNIWMSEVIKNLKDRNIEVVLDIYGDGPLKKQIEDDKYNSHINLKGEFDYSNFNTTVSDYDLFIGSGTAIIQSSSLGVPSIIGIESIEKPYTYGYFSDFYQYEYHSLSLDFDKIEVEKIIEDFYYMSESDKQFLSQEHIAASNSFTMGECLTNFLEPDVNYENTKDITKVNILRYYLSRTIFYIYCKVLNVDIYYEE